MVRHAAARPHPADSGRVWLRSFCALGHRVATLALLLASLPAHAAPEWWNNQVIANVTLEATRGKLPDEDLQPLLQAKQGAKLRAQELRADITTLYRVGDFSAVEAHVEAWPGYDDDGNEVDLVNLVYRVFTAPILKRVRFTGNRSFSDRALLEAARIAPGQAFYDDFDGTRVQERLESWMATQGYPNAQARPVTSQDQPGRVHLTLKIDEGEPDVVARVAFAGNWSARGIPESALRRWTRQAGVKQGKPLGQGDIDAAVELIRERLGEVRPGLFRKAWGYTNARIRQASLPDSDGQHITFVVEPRARLEVVTSGLGFRGRTTALDALGIDHRLRLTGGYLDEAPSIAETWLKEHGWYKATVDVELDGASTAPVRILRVDAQRRGRHTIGDVPDLRFIDFNFMIEGVERAKAARLSRDLQAVFDQASPNLLRRKYYTDSAMEAGVDAAVRYLAGQGHLQAEVSVLDPEIRPRRTIANLARSVASQPPRQRVRPRVRVVPGAVTTLANLVVEGLSADPVLPWLPDAIAERVGEPFSPQSADTLAKKLIDAHRAEGYLTATAHVVHEETGETERETTITLTPGPQVLLRSVVAKDRRLTRREVLTRTVDLELGQPVRSVAPPESGNRRDAPRTLEQVRSDLYELGVFRTVNLELLGEGPVRDLVVEVDERPRTSVEIGGGASTDQGVRAFLRYTQRNLFGLAHQFQAIGQIGLDYRSENILPDVTTPEGRAAASYTAPRFPGRNQQLTLDVTFRERRQERTLRIDQSGVGANLNASFGARERATLTLGGRVEARQLNQFDVVALLANEPWTPLIDPNEPGTPSFWRLQEAISALFLYDLRDDRVRPTRGVLLSLNGEVAPGIPWGDRRSGPPRQPTAFLKAEGRISSLIPLGPFTLKLAGGGGRLLSLNERVPPVEDRFLLGGTGSLRGFTRDGVGPHNTAVRTPADWPPGLGPALDFTTRDAPDRWVPTGGDAVADATVEFIAPLPALGATSWDGYSIAAFVDVGNVWFFQDTQDEAGKVQPDSLAPQFAAVVPTLRVGVGLGARVDTPIGPLQLDVAANPQAWFAPAGSARRTVLKSLWNEPNARIHLTLGSLF